MMARTARAVSGILALAAFGSGSWIEAQSAQSGRFTVVQLAKEMSSGVVHVEAAGRAGRRVTGSGFVVRSDGLIVTAYHLIDGAETAMVKTSDGEIYDRVDVVEYDRRRDLAVLKIKPFRPLSPLTVASSDALTVGEDAAVIGNPEGLEHSVTAGIISGHRQADGFRMIQMSAPISPGSSGSPVFSMDGKVIGVATAALTGKGVQNLNFAVPVVYLRPLLESNAAGTPLSDFMKAGGRARTAQVPRDSSGSWDVVHDHSAFTQTCRGTLLLAEHRLEFQSENSEESWSVPLERVIDISANAAYGANRGAFHVRIQDLGNFNFVAVGENGENLSPNPIISAVRYAKGSR